jgi:hypothetical protein
MTKTAGDPYARAIWRTFTSLVIVGIAIAFAFVLLMVLA